MRCKLCRRQLPNSTAQNRCECGWALDTNCREAHDDWCPTDEREGWVGAQEI